jgi:Protein of unknown function (DUF664)
MGPKGILHRYLDNQRKALLAKLEGVRERDVRWPMTQTGRLRLQQAAAEAAQRAQDPER